MKNRKPGSSTRIYGSPEGELGEPTRVHGSVDEGSNESRKDEAAFEFSEAGRIQELEQKDTLPARQEHVDRPVSPGDASENWRLPDYVEREIEQALREELGRCGSQSELRLEGRLVYVQRGDLSLTCPLGEWARKWQQLDDEARISNVSRLARALCQVRPSRPSSSRPKVLRLDRSLIVTAAAILLVGFYYLLDGSEGEGPNERNITHDHTSQEVSSNPASAQAGREETHTRAERVCANTLARIYRGGSVSIADAEGWVVEIALVGHFENDSSRTSAILSDYVEDPDAPNGSVFIWSAEADLGKLKTSDTRVTISRHPLNSSSSEPTVLVLAFKGTLVDAYFTPKERSRYHHVAHSLSQRLDATYASVYARCTSTTQHALGSWFQGQDAPKSAAALLYFMGMFANPRHVDDTFYTSDKKAKTPDHLRALLEIAARTAAVDRSSLSSIVGREGGMAFGRNNEPVTITFPFRDGNRASRASRSLARLTGMVH